MEKFTHKHLRVTLKTGHTVDFKDCTSWVINGGMVVEDATCVFHCQLVNINFIKDVK